MVTGEKRNQRALPEGVLLAQRYRICGVLGEGGFGITYEGTDLKKEKRVAIKEFFPADYAGRKELPGGIPALFVFQGGKGQFERSLAHFLKEAETLREFQYLDGIVPIFDYFEENGTAYIVMEYIEGITLKQYVKENGCLGYEELVALLEPVMKAMIQIHKRGVIHRDISPDNLLFGLDNRAWLIDFGAVSALGERWEHTRTVILKKGYAPPEQYLVEGKQGAWTDVYAMAATIYMGVTGQTPTDSVARLQGEDLPAVPLRQKGLEEWQIRAVFTGMELKIAKRYKNLEELLNALTVPPSLEDQPTGKQRELKGALRFRVANMNYLLGKGPFLKLLLGLGLIALLAAGAVLWGDSFLTEKGGGGSGQGSAAPAAEETGKPRDSFLPGESGGEPAQGSAAPASEKKKLCKMPDVTGKTKKEAIGKIKKMDSVITVRTHARYSENVKKGNIIRQSVAAGTQYNEGAIASIVLTVSKGKKKANAQETSPPQKSPASRETSPPQKADTKKDSPSGEKGRDIHVVEDEDSGYDQFQLGD